MRVVVIVLALAAAGFLVVQERGARAAADIQKVSLSGTSDPTAQQVAKAREQVKTATKWNPDTEPIVNLGVIEARAGDFRAGGATLASVTAKEPENGQAWSLLAFAAKRYDSELEATARARVRELMPPVPRAR
jgi:Flp pilus assembly protein TadD